MKITKKLLIITLLPIILLILSEVISFYHLKKSNDETVEFLNNIIERQNKISNIHSLLGYGRGIHAFKNYVLRGNSEYLLTADLTLKEALKEIDSYLLLRPLSLTEKSTLDTLKKTVSIYLSKLPEVTKLRNEGKSIQEIDYSVRIDDTQTIQELGNLDRFYTELRSKEAEEIDNNFQSLLKFIFICYFIIIILSYLLTSKISFELARSISSLMEQSKQISLFNFNSKEVHFTGNGSDELQELEIKMRNMGNTIQDAFIKLEKSNKELENYAFVTTHNIKSPLKKVSSFIEIINQDLKDKKYDKVEVYSEKIYKLVSKMNSNINSLLEYALLSHKDFEFQEVDINKIISASEEILSQEINLNNCQILKSNIPPVQGNESLLTTLFNNLITHSIKYKKENVPLSLTINYELNQSRCRIKFSDNGQGFDNEELYAIIEPYNQINFFPKVNGVGLALANCKKIIEQHKSTFIFNSEKGVGTTFEFELPLDT